MVTRALAPFALILLAAPPASTDPIHEAARSGDVDAVAALIAEDEKVVRARDADGRTPLHWAAIEGHADVARLLLDHGADADAADTRNEYPGGKFTPLHYAAHFGKPEVARVLIRAGANLDPGNIFGRTPLQILVRDSGSVAVARALLDAGADVDHMAPGTRSALHLAAWYGRHELVDLLLDRGAALPSSDFDLQSIMGFAASRRMPRLFAALQEKHGGRVRETAEGGSFLLPAAEGGAVDVMRQLLADGVDPDGADRYGNRALHGAAAAGSAPAVELLLERGADIDARDALGRLPYDLAASKGHEGVAALLRDRGAATGPPRFPILSGAYMGQQPPGLTPRLFLPGIVSSATHEHSAPAFSPDGGEVYWTPRWNEDIVFSRREGHRWTAPAAVPFGSEHGDGEPAFSVDGKRLLFLSMRPTEAGAEAGKENIWYVDATPGGWSDPKPLPEVVNGVHKHWQVSLAAGGNLYFGSRQDDSLGRTDIYVSRQESGAFQKPENLGAAINTESAEMCPYVAPDESYILFTRFPQGGNVDLFVSFRGPDGEWTEAVEMGEGINSEGQDLCPMVTPDGKYLFFLSDRNGNSDVWWVDAVVIDRLRSQVLDAGRWAEAQRIHRQATVVDAHAHAFRHDSRAEDWDIGADLDSSQVDLAKLRMGGVDVVIYSLPLPGDPDREHARQRVLDSAKTLTRALGAQPDLTRLVSSPGQLEAVVGEGKIAAMLSIEYPNAFQGEADTLNEYREAGIRSVTLAHSTVDRLADTADARPGNAGLSEFGKGVVERMNDLGVIVDLSHASDQLQRDIIATSRAPAMVSHGCARALNDIPRCVPDDILEALAAKGGVIGVTFYSGHVTSDYGAQRAAAAERFASVEKQIEAQYDEGDEAADEEVEAVWRGYAPPAARLSALIDHVDHIVDLVGPEHVAIGSDAGGARDSAVREVQDATGWPAITYELLKRGYAEADIEKILGGNLLRLYEQVESSARSR